MDSSELLKKICNGCHVVFLEDHPEMAHLYYKCGFCGYCEKKDLEKAKAIRERQKDHEYKR